MIEDPFESINHEARILLKGQKEAKGDVKYAFCALNDSQVKFLAKKKVAYPVKSLRGLRKALKELKGEIVTWIDESDDGFFSLTLLKGHDAALLKEMQDVMNPLTTIPMTHVEKNILEQLKNSKMPKRKLLAAYNCIMVMEREQKLAPDTYGSLSFLDLIAALQVMTSDVRIRAFLSKNDPQALKQAENALNGKTKRR